MLNSEKKIRAKILTLVLAETNFLNETKKT